MEFLSFPNQDLPYPGRGHIPPEYADSLLVGGEKVYLAKRYGHIFTQRIHDPDFKICQHDFSANRPEQVEPFVTDAILTLHFMLINSIDFFLHGKGKGTMQEGWYILFYVPAGKGHKAWLPKGHSRSLHLDISIALLEELASQFTELQPLLQYAKDGMGEGIHQKPVKVDAAVIKILEQFYKVPANTISQPFYIAAIRILLLFYARDISGYAREPFISGRFTFTPEDIDKLYRAKDLAIAASEGPPITISILSRKVALNTSKLKVGFRELFQSTIFDFQHSRRMAKAQVLLQTSLPLKVIAFELKYASVSSFCVAFTNHFQISPYAWRKQQIAGLAATD